MSDIGIEFDMPSSTLMRRSVLVDEGLEPSVTLVMHCASERRFNITVQVQLDYVKPSEQPGDSREEGGDLIVAV